MSLNYIEVVNKTQLLNAVSACPHDSETEIVNIREDGGRTVFRIGARNPDWVQSSDQFEKHLVSIKRKIKETPAYVWR